MLKDNNANEVFIDDRAITKQLEGEEKFDQVRELVRTTLLDGKLHVWKSSHTADDGMVTVYIYDQD